LKLLLVAGWVRGVAFILVLLAAAAHPTRAQAHASLIRSEPADRAVVAQPLATLKLTFNEPVSPLVLRLIGPTGEAIAVDEIIKDGNAIIGTLPTVLPQGTYLVSWRVISLDGHPVGGALTFSVGAPSTTPAAAPQMEADRSLRVAIWLTKIVLYVGLFGGIGGAFYAAWIAIGPLAARTRKFIVAALECGLAAAIISVGSQGLDVLGLPLSELRETHVWMAGLATSYGWTVGIALAYRTTKILSHALRRCGRLQRAPSSCHRAGRSSVSWRRSRRPRPRATSRPSARGYARVEVGSCAAYSGLPADDSDTAGMNTAGAAG
jgi:copper transport protein